MVKRSLASAATTSQSARQKAFASGQLALGRSGVTTCSPLPPVVLQKAARPSRSSRSRISCAAVDHAGEGQVLGRVEVKDQPVRTLDILRPGTPGVDLRHPHLRQRDQPFDAVDGEVGRALASDRHVPDQVGQAAHGMPLEEALGADAVRRAEQRDRPAGDMRQQARGNRLVVGGQVTLGDALLRPEQLVRVAQPDAGDNAARPVALRGAGGASPGRGTPTSAAGLSSRMPLKLAWRSSPSAVQPA